MDQARNTELDWDVALKVLPQAFADDPDRLARFEREAKVLASLNHPNFGHIYGLEEAEGQKALVLELVEGPTLADRIAQGPIPAEGGTPEPLTTPDCRPVRCGLLASGLLLRSNVANEPRAASTQWRVGSIRLLGRSIKA